MDLPDADLTDLDITQPDDDEPEHGYEPGTDLATLVRDDPVVTEWQGRLRESAAKRFAAQLNTVDLAGAISAEFAQLRENPETREHLLHAATTKLKLDIISGNAPARDAKMAAETIEILERSHGGEGLATSLDRQGSTRERVFREVRTRIVEMTERLSSDPRPQAQHTVGAFGDVIDVVSELAEDIVDGSA